jgi:hypothetical protein
MADYIPLEQFCAYAYGQIWLAPSFEQLVQVIDEFGEQHGLRAVSIVAEEVIVMLPLKG